MTPLDFYFSSKEGGGLMASCCEQCEHYSYDEEYDEYYCNVSLDEDEMEQYLKGSEVSCGFFKFYDEYKMVEKQN